MRDSELEPKSAEFDSELIDYGVNFSKPLARHQSVNKKRQMADGRRKKEFVPMPIAQPSGDWKGAFCLIPQ